MSLLVTWCSRRSRYPGWYRSPRIRYVWGGPAQCPWTSPCHHGDGRKIVYRVQAGSNGQVHARHDDPCTKVRCRVSEVREGDGCLRSHIWFLLRRLRSTTVLSSDARPARGRACPGPPSGSARRPFIGIAQFQVCFIRRFWSAALHNVWIFIALFVMTTCFCCFFAILTASRAAWAVIVIISSSAKNVRRWSCAHGSSNLRRGRPSPNTHPQPGARGGRAARQQQHAAGTRTRRSAAITVALVWQWKSPANGDLHGR